MASLASLRVARLRARQRLARQKLPGTSKYQQVLPPGPPRVKDGDPELAADHPMDGAGHRPLKLVPGLGIPSPHPGDRDRVKVLACTPVYLSYLHPALGKRNIRWVDIPAWAYSQLAELQGLRPLAEQGKAGSAETDLGQGELMEAAAQVAVNYLASEYALEHPDAHYDLALLEAAFKQGWRAAREYTTNPPFAVSPGGHPVVKIQGKEVELTKLIVGPPMSGKTAVPMLKHLASQLDRDNAQAAVAAYLKAFPGFKLKADLDTEISSHLEAAYLRGKEDAERGHLAADAPAVRQIHEKISREVMRELNRKAKEGAPYLAKLAVAISKRRVSESNLVIQAADGLPAIVTEWVDPKGFDIRVWSFDEERGLRLLKRLK